MAESPHDPLSDLANLLPPAVAESPFVMNARAELTNGIEALKQSIDEAKLRQKQTQDALAGLFGLLILLESRGERVQAADWKSNHRFVEARAVLARLGYSVDPVEVPRDVERLRARHWALLNDFARGGYVHDLVRHDLVDVEDRLKELGYPIRPGDRYHGDSAGDAKRQ